MSEVHPPTLDQLHVFLAVVEAGSFAAAARQLRRATSVVSYQIANLEAQLGLELFDRATTRRPVLSEAGRAILAESRMIASGLDGLLAKARGLNAGLEAELVLVVDVMLPTALLVNALEAFDTEFPTVTLRLQVEALGAVTQMVLDGTASVGISGPFELRVPGLVRNPIGTVRMVPVAAPGHVLARRQGQLPCEMARNQVQLVLTDRSRLTEGQEFAVLATRTWRLGDLGSKHALLLAGVGWGAMPEAMVRDDLATGRLVRLNIDAWDNQTMQLHSLHRAADPPGPGGRWLIERLRAAEWPA